MTHLHPVHSLIGLVARPFHDRLDAELLDRYTRYAESAAFDELVRRHGPMVLAVCRRGLTQTADADDAFQATFLVLLRKMRTLRDPGRLGPWLYGVAVRVTARARRRTGPTAEATDMIPDPTPPAADRDWLPILDRELAALPAKYREALVLCELQGTSRAEAARRLGVKEGTLSSRLARGRGLLRTRLLKHGTLLPAGGLVALVGTAESVPASMLAKMTAVAGGTVSSAVRALTEEAMRTMMVSKLKLAVGAMVVGLGVVVGLTAAAPADEKAKPGTPATAAKPATPVVTADAKPTGDLAGMQGLWELQTADPNPGANKAIELPQFRNYIVGNTIWHLDSSGVTTERFSMTIDATQDPKYIDFTTPDGTHRGIYRSVAGSGWEVVFSRYAKIRPAQFEDDGVTVLNRIRWVPVKSPPTPVTAERKAILGRWQIVRQEYPHDDLSMMVRKEAGGVVVIEPEFLFIQRPADEKTFIWEVAEYTLDASKKRPWIDLKFVGRQKLPTGFGVYELAGDTLRISYRVGLPRALRTLEFISGIEETGYSDNPKVACALLELKRETDASATEPKK